MYEAVDTLLRGVIYSFGLKQFDIEDIISKSSSDTSSASLLFGPEVAAFIGEVKMHLRKCEQDWLRKVDEGEPLKYETMIEEINGIGKYQVLGEVIFRPYLQLHYHENWFKRQKAKADNWMNTWDTAMDGRREKQPPR